MCITIDIKSRICYIIITFWCGTQAVRDWSAKPSLVGSTPIHTLALLFRRAFFYPSPKKKTLIILNLLRANSL